MSSSAEWDKILLGAIKNVSRRDRRNRTTSFGLSRSGRNVVDSKLEGVAGKDTYNGDFSESAEVARRISIIAGQIRDWCKDPRDAQLITRRLLNGEKIKTLAIEFLLNRGTARSKVHRARKYLCIPKRNQQR